MTTATLAPIKLLDSAEYYGDLVRSINAARRRVAVLTLLVCKDASTAALFDALEAAVRRGVVVTVVYDAHYSKLYLAGKKRWDDTQRELQMLRELGAMVHGHGSRSLNPLKGRFHSKVSLVDDIVYSFGGMNLAMKATENADYMLRWQSSTLARSLQDYIQEVITNPDPARDAIVRVDDQSTLLIDHGLPGESVIYDEACRMVSGAEKVWYVSQFCPTGRLAALLAQKSAACYFNRSRDSNALIGTMLAVDTAITGMRSRYSRGRYIHAKFILTESSTGEREVVSGSHNFKMHGVRYGTAEIALHSTDFALWDSLYAFFARDIA